MCGSTTPRCRNGRSIRPCRWKPAEFRSGHVAVEDLDQHVLRAPDKGDADAGADRLWLDRELGAFRLQLVADPVDVADAQPEVIEPDKAASCPRDRPPRRPGR